MNVFCGSPIWDFNLTWNTTDPTFTSCFQKTVLMWIPCSFLWLFTPLEIFFIKHYQRRPLNRNILNLSKWTLIILLMMTQLADYLYVWYSYNKIEQVYSVYFYTPVIKMCTLVLCLVLMILMYKKGKHTSGILFIFWLLLTLGSSVEMYSLIKEAIRSYIIMQTFPFIIYCIYFVSCVGELILSTFADVSLAVRLRHASENRSPEETASFLSNLAFTWFDGFVWRGHRRPLVYDDLWKLNDSVRAVSACECFDRSWRNEIKKTKRCDDQSSSRETLLSGETETRSSASVAKALWRSFGISLMVSTVLNLLGDFSGLLTPILLQQLITFVESNDPLWHGIFFVILLCVAILIESLFYNKHSDVVMNVSLRMNSALMSALYKKSLKISSAQKRTSTVGEIVNLMSVDISRMSETLIYIPTVLTFPIQILIAAYMMWNLMGISALIGLSVFLVTVPMNAYLARCIEKLELLIMEHKDERINVTNDVLSGIKVIKLYAWEPSFNEKINCIRKKELKAMKKMFWLNSLTWFLSNTSPLLISIIMFATYVLTSDNHILTPSLAFVSLTLIKIIEEPVGYATEMIGAIVQMRVSIKRLNNFMNLEELDEDQIQHCKNENVIIIENGMFSWQLEGESILKNLHLTIPQGSLVAIVGPVGSGKSSLLMAILGEMEKVQGEINTYGSIAYVPQIAWIQNATLKDNIIFDGKIAEDSKYNMIIDACALRTDLAMLPKGDLTEIGEKGINLSGGQKQRVSLARAVYKNADIYLLDDPLSSVDSQVGKHIFDNVIGPKSLLKNKTRILVTHGLVHLCDVDFIITLDEGKIIEQGSYQELLNKNGLFTELLKLSQTKIGNDNSIEVENISSKGNIQRQISGRSTDYEDDDSLYDENSSCESDTGRLIRSETIATGQVGWHVYRYYLVSIGKLASIVFFILFTIEWSAAVAADVWLSFWSNDSPSSGVELRNIRLSVYSALGGVHSIFMFSGYIVAQLTMIRASRLLHEDMLLKILRSPMSFFDVTPLGRIINRFSHDIDTIDSVLPDIIMSMLEELFQLLGIVVIICMSNPTVAAVLFPIGVLYYVIQKFYISTSRQLKRLSSNYRSPIYSHFSETLNGLSTIRAFKMHNNFIEEFNNKIDEYHKVAFPSYAASRWLSIRLDFLGAIVVFSTALFAVTRRESIDSGTLGLSLSYAITITFVFSEIAKLLSKLEIHIVSVERIREYKELDSEFAWNLDYENINSNWPREGRIQFINYSARYREGLDLALTEISCDIHHGEKVGVVGRTGAGKTTLTLALFRVIEASGGKILIDGIDIARLGLHTIRSRITIIPQDPVLFFGTLRMNLDPFNNFTDQQLWDALEHSHLKEFVTGLDEGLHYPINEGGENLSVGQRQLLCLARALLRKSKILILDEATAAVDLETDELIQATIRKEFADCTILTIAHRLNTIMDSTRVLVLQNGVIKEFNSPESLLQNPSSLFFSMAKDAGILT